MTREEIVDATNVQLVIDGQEPLADWESALIPSEAVHVLGLLLARHMTRERHEDQMQYAEQGV